MLAWLCSFADCRGADLHMAHLMPLPFTISCSSKSRFVLPFWYRLTQVLLLLQTFYGSLDFVWNNPGKSVPEETFTHSHLSWSSIIPYLLPPFFTIHSILYVQFTCLTVFFRNLSPSFLWSTSWPGTLHFILLTFLHPVIDFFSQHMPIPSQPVLL